MIKERSKIIEEITEELISMIADKKVFKLDDRMGIILRDKYEDFITEEDSYVLMNEIPEHLIAFMRQDNAKNNEVTDFFLKNIQSYFEDGAEQIYFIHHLYDEPGQISEALKKANIPESQLEGMF